MNLDQEELRNRRIFEIIPQFTNINSGSGASGLKLVLGPNQMGFTLSDNNVNPELIYRLPDTWVGRSALNEGTTSWTDSGTGDSNSSQFSTFVPKFGNAFFTGLKIRYFNSDNYSWAVPYIYKQSGANNIPVSTVDLQNHLNFNGISTGGNDYLHGTFATNRQVLAYFYQFISHLATVGGLPQSNTFMYTDKNGTGNSPSYDLILEFHNQLIPVITNIGTTVFVPNTEFNTYKDTIDSQFDAVYSSIITPPVVQPSSGGFAIWDTNSNMNELDQNAFYFNTTTNTLETENILLSGEIETSKLISPPSLPLSFRSQTNFCNLQFDNNKDLIIEVDNNGAIYFNDGTDNVLSLNNNNSVSLMNTLKTINGAPFIITPRLTYEGTLAGTTNDFAILNQLEIKSLIDNQTVYLEGDDDFILYKDSITSQTTNALKRIAGVVYDNFSLVNNESTFGYLDTPNTARTLYNGGGAKLVSAGAFLSFLEIENVINTKIASSNITIDQILLTAGNELKTLRVSSSNDIETIDYLIYVDAIFVDDVEYVPAPGDGDFSHARRLHIQNQTLLFSDGMEFNEGNFEFKPLTYIATLIDRYPGSLVPFQKYIPNTLEIVQELDARSLEADSILLPLLQARPLKEFLKIPFIPSSNGDWTNGAAGNSYNGSTVQRGHAEYNGIMIDCSDLNNEQTVIRINSLIQLNGTPVGPNDSSQNKTILNPILDDTGIPISNSANNTIKWNYDPYKYANPNIDMVTTENTETNNAQVRVQPHQVSILSYIDYANNPIEGQEYGTTLGMVISPLTYTYSSDYIQFFMKYRTNVDTPELTDLEVTDIIDQQIRNIGMYTNRDILPKIAIADLCDAKIATIPSQFYNTIINTKYKVHANPVGSIIVTGTADGTGPNFTGTADGTYVFIGESFGLMTKLYQRGQDNVWIGRINDTWWYITNQPDGLVTSASYSLVNLSPIGIYTPINGSTGAPEVINNPAGAPANTNPNAIFNGWTQGSIGLSTTSGYTSHTPTAPEQWISTVSGFNNTMFEGNHWLYFTDRDAEGNLYNFVLTQGLAVGDTFELDILRLRTDWVASASNPIPTLNDYTVDGTLVYSIIGEITSALVPAVHAGYAPKWVPNNIAPDYGTWEIDYNVNIYKIGVVLNEELTSFPIDTRSTESAEFKDWLFDVNETPYIRMKLQIASKQMWLDNLQSITSGTLQVVCEGGRTTDTGIIITDIGLLIDAGGAQINGGGLVVKTSSNVSSPTNPNIVTINTFGGDFDGISYNSNNAEQTFRIKYVDSVNQLSSSIDLFNNYMNLQLFNDDTQNTVVNKLEMNNDNITTINKVITEVDQLDVAYTFNNKEFVTYELLDSKIAAVTTDNTLRDILVYSSADNLTTNLIINPNSTPSIGTNSWAIPFGHPLPEASKVIELRLLLGSFITNGIDGQITVELRYIVANGTTSTVISAGSGTLISTSILTLPNSVGAENNYISHTFDITQASVFPADCMLFVVIKDKNAQSAKGILAQVVVERPGV